MVAEVAVTAPSDHDVGFDAFVTARGQALWRRAWLLTGDRHRAEDLVQTALAKTWNRFDRFDDVEQFEAYVRTTLFRTYLSWWRRRWTAEVPGSADPGAVRGSDLDLRRDLSRALAELPRQQRAVVVLIYVEDLTQAQAAEVLGVSVGTVKSTLSRALAKLRVSPLLDGSQS